MAVQTSFIAGVPGAWVKLCEYREQRKSLLIQLIGGAAILLPGTNSPSTFSTLGIVPAGFWHSDTLPNAPAAFRLSSEIDGELVIQEWWAWVIGTSLPTPTPPTQTFTASGIWTCPSGVTSVTATCTGGGGAGSEGNDAGPPTQSGAGGGGGAFAQSVLPVSQGVSYVVTVGAGSVGGSGAGASWFSLAGPIPALPTDGTLAQPGVDGGPFPLLAGGPGGAAVASIGDTTTDGGIGGAGVVTTLLLLLGGGGGGGGAGTVIAGTAGSSDIGNTGLNQPGGVTGGGQGGAAVGTAAQFGFPGDVPGGGGGGGGSAQGGGLIWGGGDGANGQVVLSWTQPGGSVPIITVSESFEVVVPPAAPKFFTVALPRLSPDAIEALQDLLTRVQGQMEPVE